MRELLKKIRDSARDYIINRKNREKLQNQEFTIIASDCTGAMIYHDLKVRFDSPTINLYMSASDYIKFISRMEHYLQVSMKEIEVKEVNYPCAKLDDIILYLVHYKTFDEAKEKWEARKRRIHPENIFYIFNDRNGCTEEDVEKFFSLPLQNKIFFTANREWEVKHSDAFFVDRFAGEQFVGVMTSYCGLSLKRNYDCFDYVGWFNGD